MKQNVNKYPVVDTLPAHAVTVKEYAEQESISTAYIYKMIKEAKNNFKIVVFHGTNFIIPN